MILGQDQAMLFPTMDLYDSGMMQMYANAVQREYERGLNDQKEFIAKYGDFISPIASDVEYWNANTMDPLADTIDKMRAAGIDPTRSPEARAILSRQMMNLPYAKLAEMKQSAKAAEQYMKTRAEMQAKGLWNPELEKQALGGRTLETWNTDKYGMWTRTSPVEYKDLNNWTSHIFDNMELSYDPEESKKYPGFMAYTKNKDTMQQILDTQLPGLLSSDLGKFYLQKAKDQIRVTNPNLSSSEVEQQALSQLRGDIINANWERSQVKLETDPYEQMRVQNQYAESLARVQGQYKGRGGKGSGSDSDDYNYIDGLTARGISNVTGDDPLNEIYAADKMVASQYTFGQQHSTPNVKKGPHQAFKERAGAYLNQYCIRESKSQFTNAIGGRPKISGTDRMYLEQDDVNKLYSTESLVTNTYGYTNKPLYTNRSNINVVQPVSTTASGIKNVKTELIPGERVYTALFKDGKVKQFWEVYVQEHDTKGGALNLEQFWYLLPNESEQTIGLPKLNEFHTNKKTGKVTVKPNSKGQRRDRPKTGYNQKNKGIVETSTISTNSRHKVTKNGYSQSGAYADESISE